MTARGAAARAALLAASASLCCACSATAPSADGAAATRPSPPREAVDLDAPAPFGQDDRLPLAIRLYEAGRKDDARRVADRVLADDPRHPRADVALFLAAEGRYAAGEFDAAYAQYVLLIERHPTSRLLKVVPERLYGLGLALLDKEPATLIEALAPSLTPAVEALSRVAVDFPGSKWADDAWLRLGEAHVKEGRPEYAALAYDRLTREHPDSELAEEACWRVATSLDSMTQGAKYDAAPLAEARRAAARYLKRYGEHGKFADAAAKLIRDATDAMVEHERGVAAFYARAGNVAAADLHSNNASKLLGADLGGPDSLDQFAERFERPPWQRDRPLPLILRD